MRHRIKFPNLLMIVIVASAFLLDTNKAGAQVSSLAVIPNPILFVTQVPVATFTDVSSTFGNHKTQMDYVGRGGDLWIKYPNGDSKNLTLTAGYGIDSNGNGILEGNEGIAVRDPSMYWDGTKAIFSMVVGGPAQRYQVTTQYWQMYEITGLQENDTPVITKVPNQPSNYNNVSPIYASDDSIIFTTDRPRNGSPLLYPQLDEYEEAPVVTGLWKLDPASGDLTLINHAPSGDFSPLINSYGQIVFTQWDHLQRDQQADGDQEKLHPGSTTCGGTKYGTFNYASEDSASYNLNNRAEVFPEARQCRTDLNASLKLTGHSFNVFMPWAINQDGTGGETLNHIGRQEFLVYTDKTFVDDPNLNYYSPLEGIANTKSMQTGMFQIAEDPLTAGLYYGVDTLEFGVHSSGRIFKVYAPPGLNADQITVQYVTHPDTYGTTPTPNHSGRYREPLPLSNGTLLAVHTPIQGEETNYGINSIYTFRIQSLTLGANGYYAADQYLTNGITKTLSYWSPDSLVSYSGPLWELNPVEVRATTTPPFPAASISQPEMDMFNQAGVTPSELQDWLKTNNLAMVVGHNVTRRDDMDVQQPFNLQVPNGAITIGATGKIYNISFLQFFQADQLRGLTGCCSATPGPGRRVLAQPMHDPAALAFSLPGTGPAGSVSLSLDGSFAAFVPAQRAMTWQLTDNSGKGIVRERYWLTFQPGEIRVCKSCHGLNNLDQAGNTDPENSPQALLTLLQGWKVNQIPKSTITLAGSAPADGWILESSETSNQGGTKNNSATTLNLGDNAAKKQYLGVLSFDTSNLPTGAVITKVTLSLKKAAVVGGGNPVKKFRGFMVDMQNGNFGAFSLEVSDFETAAAKTFGSFKPSLTNGWYNIDLTNGAAYINPAANTQIRLRFKKDDNNDLVANYLQLYSGNAGASDAPQLVIEYYLP